MKKAIIITCFDWNNQRLEVVDETLLEKGYMVKILTSDFNHIKKEKITERQDIYTYIEVPGYKKNISLQRLISHLCFTKSIYKILQKESPNLVYALLPPNSLAKVCAKYKKRNKCYLFFDVIDLWPESLPVDKFHNTLPYKIWRNLRENCLNNADHVFLECGLYKELLEKVKKENCSVLYLYKNQTDDISQEILNILKKYEKKKDKIILGYLGSINYIIDIEKICKVIKCLAAKTKVEMRIIGDGESRELLINEAKKVGAEVNYYGKIFEEKRKIAILSECDYALNLMRDSVKVGLTIKSIDYLSYGLPLINNIKGDTWQLVEKENIGVNYDGNLENVWDYINSGNVNIHMRAFEVYQKYFTKQVAERKILKVFEEIIKN